EPIQTATALPLDVAATEGAEPAAAPTVAGADQVAVCRERHDDSVFAPVRHTATAFPRASSCTVASAASGSPNAVAAPHAPPAGRNEPARPPAWRQTTIASPSWSIAADASRTAPGEESWTGDDQTPEDVLR